MVDADTAVPASIRRLDSADAGRLIRLVEAYDELQTVLQCCERLLTLLNGHPSGADDLGVEALWTLALLSYGRAFGPGGLTEEDLRDSGSDGDAVKGHRVLLHLRDYHADASANPRETYTVGVAQGADGAVNAVAVTSVGAPRVDAAAVRQAGAIAFPLCGVLDERIGAMQGQILADVRDISRAELAAMDLIEVAAPAEG
ncbi:MAG TPA: hypothetical protein VFU35_16005 [Jatrophihabitans sp.]|nr:hypothetical protein [Jatrophihabitans sp.]